VKLKKEFIYKIQRWPSVHAYISLVDQLTGLVIKSNEDRRNKINETRLKKAWNGPSNVQIWCLRDYKMAACKSNTKQTNYTLTSEIVFHNLGSSSYLVILNFHHKSTFIILPQFSVISRYKHRFPNDTLKIQLWHLLYDQNLKPFQLLRATIVVKYLPLLD
jgi:hypothetical protein